MESQENWTPVILQNLVAAVLFAVGAVLIAWAKMRNWRWSSPLTHGLVVLVCLHFLWHGFSRQWVGTSHFWLSLAVFLGGTVFLFYVDSWGEKQEQEAPLVINNSEGENEEPLERPWDVSLLKARYGALPLVEAEVKAPQWSLPSAMVVLQVVARLRRVSNEIPVKIVAGNGGRAVADLLVRIFQLTEWTLQDDPHSASYVFPLPHESSLQGIRVRCRDLLPRIGHTSVFLESELDSLFPGEVRVEPFPETDTYNFFQIEIGSLPFSL